MSRRQVTVQTGLGPIRAVIEQPAEPIRLARFAELIRPLTDALTAAGLEAAARAQRRVSCTAGCGACCRQLVTISPAEAFMIAERVVAAPGPDGEALRARFDALERLLARAGMFRQLLHLDDPVLGGADHYAIARQYFALGEPCPFLVDEHCSIHDERPALCREFHVVSPAGRCANPFANRIEHWPHPAPVSQALTNLCAQLMGGEIHPVPLGLALRYARDRPEMAVRTFSAERLVNELLLHLEIQGGLIPAADFA